MTLEHQLMLAFGLDLVLGDPPGWPHPVRWIGAAARRMEDWTRASISDARAAGIVTAAGVVGGTALVAWALLNLAAALHPWLRDALSVLLLYTTLAARDLWRHAARVTESLQARDLPEARRRVGWIVGRDTDGLDEEGVARATVESVAENLVDGVTAPLFFAALGGPVAALAYKAASTLDSMFGYRNERYLAFGWASARLDDLLAWLPARLTVPLVAVAARLAGLDAAAAWRIGRRDGRRHASPNAGLSEAAFAGALGLVLGGPSSYGGRVVDKPTLGEGRTRVGSEDIGRACSLMLVTAFLSLFAFVAFRAVLPGGTP